MVIQFIRKRKWQIIFLAIISLLFFLMLLFQQQGSNVPAEIHYFSHEEEAFSFGKSELQGSGDNVDIAVLYQVPLKEKKGMIYAIKRTSLSPNDKEKDVICFYGTMYEKGDGYRWEKITPDFSIGSVNMEFDGDYMAYSVAVDDYTFQFGRLFCLEKKLFYENEEVSLLPGNTFCFIIEKGEDGRFTAS